MNDLCPGDIVDRWLPTPLEKNTPKVVVLLSPHKVIRVTPYSVLLEYETSSDYSSFGPRRQQVIVDWPIWKIGDADPAWVPVPTPIPDLNFPNSQDEVTA